MPQMISDYDVLVLWLGPAILILSITALALRITRLTAMVDVLAVNVRDLAKLVHSCALYRDMEQRMSDAGHAIENAKVLVNGK